MPLRPSDVGSRVVVRHRLAEPEPGGPTRTDLLGVLVAIEPAGLVVVADDGRTVRIAADRVLAARPVPPRPDPRPGISPEDLELVCAEGWPPRTVEPLGQWRLREAAGFTGRANSVLPVGDPGLPFAAALDRVVAFYRARGLPPRAQVVVGAAVEQPFLDAGWRVEPHKDGALVQVAAVTAALRRTVPGPGPEVLLLDTPTPGWMHRYGRTAGVPDDVVAGVLAGVPAVAFAAVEPDHPGGPVAIGRGVVTGPWLGLAAVEVVPERRRQGLARRVVDALLAWGADHGARYAYLQTVPANRAALGLYERYGFVTHHHYRYLAPAPAAPGPPAAGPAPSR